jgi:hypothetical protein
LLKKFSNYKKSCLNQNNVPSWWNGRHKKLKKQITPFFKPSSTFLKLQKLYRT